MDAGTDTSPLWRIKRLDCYSSKGIWTCSQPSRGLDLLRLSSRSVLVPPYARNKPSACSGTTSRGHWLRKSLPHQDNRTSAKLVTASISETDFRKDSLNCPCHFSAQRLRRKWTCLSWSLLGLPRWASVYSDRSSHGKALQLKEGSPTDVNPFPMRSLYVSTKLLLRVILYRTACCHEQKFLDVP